MEPNNKVALVTGAGSEIGQAIAIRLAREGAHIIVNDIDMDGSQLLGIASDHKEDLRRRTEDSPNTYNHM